MTYRVCHSRPVSHHHNSSHNLKGGMNVIKVQFEIFLPSASQKNRYMNFTLGYQGISQLMGVQEVIDHTHD